MKNELEILTNKNNYNELKCVLCEKKILQLQKYVKIDFNYTDNPNIKFNFDIAKTKSDAYWRDISFYHPNCAVKVLTIFMQELERYYKNWKLKSDRFIEKYTSEIMMEELGK